MCGRFVLDASGEAVQQAFNLEIPPDLVPRFNIAPSQAVGIISNQDPRALTFVRWGLIPSWAKDPSIGNQMINARAETAAEKPSFKNALRRRRCLIPANGFYEWPQKGSPPIYIHLQDHALFAFAGLWEVWNSPTGEEIRTCTILTTEPNDFVKAYHHRMAIIMRPEHYAAWLDPDERAAMELMPLLNPIDAESMRAYEVSKAVNSPANDSPDLIQPLRSADQPPLF
jgi:putative SOS response-associated peptidase YedK